MGQTIQVPGTFENIIDGKLANAEQIYDATEGKSQSAINAKVKEDVEAAEGDISNLQTAVADTYNKSAIDTALSAKQDSISDLATIRSGASAGATAVQPADMTSALADKQDTIADLATIRSGASAGATAVQPADMTSALADKQDTIADLATIRSGASAGATAVQPADMTSALADKQDTIVDLATIRSGASAGATAVQPADMTSALADKQDTIVDLATIRSGASAGATAVQPADMTSALADKQDTIADLATIRSGASAGATAVQPAALEAEVSRAQAAELTKANAADVYTKTEVNGMVSTPHQNYVTVADYASLPAVADGQPDTIYRVANYDGAYNSGAGRVDATKYTEYAYSNNALILLSVKSAVGEVFDISEYNSNAIYNSLTEALGTNGANIPADNQRGGMSVKFVKRINYALYNVTVVSNQDSSQVPGWGDSGNIDINEPLIEGNNITAEAIVANLDTTVVADHSEKGDALAAIQALALNGSAKFQYTDTYTPEDQQVGIPVYTLYTVTKTTNEATEYVQYRLMSTAWSIATSNWQGVDDEPIAGSNSLVRSGGVQNELALGAIYDVSAKNPTAGSNNDGKFESLSALLSDANLNTLIPTSVRKGGMSIKFVQSSDNKYVQYFLTKDEWSTTEGDWEKLNLEGEVSQLEKKVSVIDSGVIDLLTPTETRISGIKFPLEEGDAFLSGDGSDVVNYFPVKKGDCVHLISQCATGMTNRWVAAGFCNSIPAVGVGIVSRYAVKLANDTIIDKKDFVAADDGYFAIGYRYTTMTHTVSVERVSVVKYTEQVLTDEQKEQARINIDAVGNDEVALQNCATYFGFTVSLIKKFSGIYNLNGDSDQTSDNLLNGFQSEDMQLELSDGIIEVQTSDNTELQWTNGVAYEDLVKYDYNTVFVKYNDNYPYYIECIGIAYDGVTFTEEEKVLLSKFFRLPLFRNGKMLMDGIVKGNRGLSVASPPVNLVSSPEFKNPSEWTYGPAWTLSLGNASCNDAGTAYSLLQNVNMEVGSRYKVLFKVSDYQSGELEFRVDYNLFVSSAITANGIYEIEFDYTSGGHPSHVKEIMFRPTASGFVGSINYVELYKES